MCSTISADCCSPLRKGRPRYQSTWQFLSEACSKKQMGAPPSPRRLQVIVVLTQGNWGHVKTIEAHFKAIPSRGVSLNHGYCCYSSVPTSPWVFNHCSCQHYCRRCVGFFSSRLRIFPFQAVGSLPVCRKP